MNVFSSIFKKRKERGESGVARGEREKEREFFLQGWVDVIHYFTLLLSPLDFRHASRRRRRRFLRNLGGGACLADVDRGRRRVAVGERKKPKGGDEGALRAEKERAKGTEIGFSPTSLALVCFFNLLLSLFLALSPSLSTQKNINASSKTSSSSWPRSLSRGWRSRASGGTWSGGGRGGGEEQREPLPPRDFFSSRFVCFFVDSQELLAFSRFGEQKHNEMQRMKAQCLSIEIKKERRSLNAVREARARVGLRVGLPLERHAVSGRLLVGVRDRRGGARPDRRRGRRRRPARGRYRDGRRERRRRRHRAGDAHRRLDPPDGHGHGVDRAGLAVGGDAHVDQVLPALDLDKVGQHLHDAVLHLVQGGLGHAAPVGDEDHAEAVLALLARGAGL